MNVDKAAEKKSMRKMDRALKAKWLKALRSGKFPQARSSLCVPPTELVKGYAFCCLGVLATLKGRKPTDLMGKCDLGEVRLKSVLGPWSRRGDDDNTYSSIDEDSADTPQRKLAFLNDGGWSFREIADWIEANL